MFEFHIQMANWFSIRFVFTCETVTKKNNSARESEPGRNSLICAYHYDDTSKCSRVQSIKTDDYTSITIDNESPQLLIEIPHLYVASSGVCVLCARPNLSVQ